MHPIASELYRKWKFHLIQYIFYSQLKILIGQHVSTPQGHPQALTDTLYNLRQDHLYVI
jgi:hypothetical protein